MLRGQGELPERAVSLAARAGHQALRLPPAQDLAVPGRHQDLPVLLFQGVLPARLAQPAPEPLGPRPRGRRRRAGGALPGARRRVGGGGHDAAVLPQPRGHRPAPAPGHHPAHGGRPRRNGRGHVHHHRHGHPHAQGGTDEAHDQQGRQLQRRVAQQAVQGHELEHPCRPLRNRDLLPLLREVGLVLDLAEAPDPEGAQVHDSGHHHPAGGAEGCIRGLVPPAACRGGLRGRLPTEEAGSHLSPGKVHR
mmetsp:Transcript_51586/g.156363  ORF Transcript_51586/g.156363 Transcript_51586/m.156363 type:complete len:249 (-) Transcript_51586:1027-1773(-)